MLIEDPVQTTGSSWSCFARGRGVGGGAFCRWCHGAMVNSAFQMSWTCHWHVVVFAEVDLKIRKRPLRLNVLYWLWDALRILRDFESASVSFCHTPPKASPAAGLEVWQAPSFILVRRCFELGHVSIIEFIHSKVTCSKEVLKLNMTFDKGTASDTEEKPVLILFFLTSRKLRSNSHQLWRFFATVFWTKRYLNIKWATLSIVKTQDPGTDAGNCSGWACLSHRFLSLTTVDYNPY